MILRFLLDECCAPVIAARLRSAGHACMVIRDFAQGVPDDAVFAHATADDAILISQDWDFADKVVLQERWIAGLILIDMHGASGEARADRLLEVVKEQPDQFAARLTIMTRRRVRSRPLLRP